MHLAKFDKEDNLSDETRANTWRLPKNATCKLRTGGGFLYF